MRRLRRLGPDRLWDVTVRCHHGRFRLLPTRRRTELVGFWSAKANARFDGIEIVCVTAMSNHLHMVVRDRRSELSAFMQYFLGYLARDLNRMDGTWGAVFERRYSSIEILDEAALADRVSYTVCNPVAAGLVSRHEDWPGLLMWRTSRRTFTRFRDAAWRRARARDPEADRAKFTETVELAVVGAPVEDAVKAREIRLQATVKAFLGAKRVLRQSPMGTPTESKRTPMPLCHTTDKQTRFDYRCEWNSFVAAYRAASERFRAGYFEAVFPRFCFRPAPPLLR